MAKIDLSKLEGYDKMSPEEKLKALESYDIPEPDYSGHVKKEDYDKDIADLQRKYDELLRNSKVAGFKAELLALGYDEALADDTAAAMADGDAEKVLSNQKKHLDAAMKKARGEALKDTPPPAGGGGSQTMTLKELRAMSPAERLKFSQEHPEDYKQLYGGNE